jgi:MFS family permease
LLGGLAPTAEVLLVARAVQGLGGALAFPATLALVNTSFAEGAERNRALAVWGGAGAAGLVVGVLLGGVLTQAFGWEAVFFVNVPLATIAVVLAFALIPVDRPREIGRRFDLPGALSATVGITLLVFALVQGRTSAGDLPASRPAQRVVCSRWWRSRSSSGVGATHSCHPGCSPIATSPPPWRSPSSSGLRSAQSSTS